jgi:FHA domain
MGTIDKFRAVFADMAIRSVHHNVPRLDWARAFLKSEDWPPNVVSPERGPDLLIEDEKPFRLSRHHFMITRSDNELVITDLDSTLGTIANEHAIGHHFMRHTAPLRRGENRVVAGGRGSPFEFTVSVGHLAEAPNARILLK